MPKLTDAQKADRQATIKKNAIEAALSFFDNARSQGANVQEKQDPLALPIKSIAVGQSEWNGRANGVMVGLVLDHTSDVPVEITVRLAQNKDDQWVPASEIVNKQVARPVQARRDIKPFFDASDDAEYTEGEVKMVAFGGTCSIRVGNAQIADDNGVMVKNSRSTYLFKQIPLGSMSDFVRTVLQGANASKKAFNQMVTAGYIGKLPGSDDWAIKFDLALYGSDLTVYNFCTYDRNTGLPSFNMDEDRWCLGERQAYAKKFVLKELPGKGVDFWVEFGDNRKPVTFDFRGSIASSKRNHNARILKSQIAQAVEASEDWQVAKQTTRKDASSGVQTQPTGPRKFTRASLLQQQGPKSREEVLAEKSQATVPTTDPADLPF